MICIVYLVSYQQSMSKHPMCKQPSAIVPVPKPTQQFDIPLQRQFKDWIEITSKWLPCYQDHSVIANSACIIRHGDTSTSKTLLYTYTRKHLHKTVYTVQRNLQRPKTFCARSLLHQKTCTPDNFFTKEFTPEASYTRNFAPENFYTKDNFPPDTVHTRCLLHQKPFCTMNYELYHQEPFAPEVFYIRNHFHQKKNATADLYTRDPLHQNFLLRNSLQVCNQGRFPTRKTYPARIYTKRFYTGQFLQHNMFPLEIFYAKKKYKKLWHQKISTPEPFYSTGSSHQSVFTPENPFAPKAFDIFYTRNFYTKQPSNQKTFTPNIFLAKELLHHGHCTLKNVLPEDSCARTHWIAKSDFRLQNAMGPCTPPWIAKGKKTTQTSGAPDYKAQWNYAHGRDARQRIPMY